MKARAGASQQNNLMISGIRFEPISIPPEFLISITSLQKSFRKSSDEMGSCFPTYAPIENGLVLFFIYNRS